MELVDITWIRKRLTGRHGEKAALAKALGIRRDVLSKILNGTRQIKSSEIPRLVKFFEGDSSLSEVDRHFLKVLRDVPQERLAEVERYMRYLAAQDASEPKASADPKDETKAQ